MTTLSKKNYINDDALWSRIAPLLPPPKARRYRYPGRKPLDDRRVLSGILYVLLKEFGGGLWAARKMNLEGVRVDEDNHVIGDDDLEDQQQIAETETVLDTWYVVDDGDLSDPFPYLTDTAPQDLETILFSGSKEDAEAYLDRENSLRASDL